MKLPIGLSVPHAGLDVPNCVRPFNRLSEEEIVVTGGGAKVRDYFA